MIKDINVVILMAGEGERFKIAGYRELKPFVEIQNKMMIEHVFESFKFFNCSFLLVVQEKVLETKKEKFEKLKQKYNIKISTVPHLTMGAAITALSAIEKLNKNQDLLFVDCDNIYKPKDIENFILDSRKRMLDASLLTFSSNEAVFSYAKVNEDNLLIQTKEKEVISNFAIAGAYYFKNVELFQKSAIDLIVDGDLSKKEFYMSALYNCLLKRTKNISIFKIENFSCVGTPIQLENFIKEKSVCNVL